MRHLASLLILVAALTAAAGAAHGASPEEAGDTAAEAAMLRETVRVDGQYVHLGDLFMGAGEKADVRVAYAPDPGKRSVFDATWLYRVARAYGLDWRPLSTHDQIVVERDSIVIEREEIEDRILAALADRGAEADTQVEVGNRMLRIHVPADAPAALDVADVVFDERTRRFTAVIVAPADHPSSKRYRITGRLHRVTEVPVLARRVLAGEVIGRRDVTWARVRTSRLQRDVVVDAADLIGKAPRRGLRAGTPVRTSQIRRPVMVPKGGLVTMVLHTPKMTLTARGRALEEGSDGDTIRVTNTQSSTVVEAVVIGAGEVTVRPVDHVVAR